MKWVISSITLITMFFWSNAFSAVSSKEKILGQSGIWQVVTNNDPFADKPTVCNLQSETVGEEGSRRKEARIRINLQDSTIFVDPSIDLKRVIMANRHIIDKRSRGIQNDPTRFLPDNILYHTFRIDQGLVFEQSVQDPEFGEWAVHKDITDKKDFDKAINNLSNGNTLFYKWNLENGEQVFEYDLVGFKEMVELYKQQCP